MIASDKSSRHHTAHAVKEPLQAQSLFTVICYKNSMAGHGRTLERQLTEG